jgi:uncharacterized phiE125 gp8 family phage protein
MNYKIITPVSVEPVTLAEAKTFLRLTSDTFDGDVTTSQSIAPGTYTATAYTGTAVDVLGLVAMATLNYATCAGTITAKMQESDDNVTWYDYANFEVVTSTNDNTVQELAYSGVKQYIRILAVVTGTCSFSADIVTKTGDVVEDALTTGLITTAREYCEGFTRRALATQTVEAYLPDFPHHDRFELPLPPLQSVASVKYKNSAGAETTMTENTQYIVDTDSLAGAIVLPYMDNWPSFTPYPVNAVKIRFTAGYNALNPMPKSIKQAMLLLIGHWYTNREAVGSVGDEIALAVKALLFQHKAGWF